MSSTQTSLSTAHGKGVVPTTQDQYEFEVLRDHPKTRLSACEIWWDENNPDGVRQAALTWILQVKPAEVLCFLRRNYVEVLMNRPKLLTELIENWSSSLPSTIAMLTVRDRIRLDEIIEHLTHLTTPRGQAALWQFHRNIDYFRENADTLHHEMLEFYIKSFITGDAEVPLFLRERVLNEILVAAEQELDIYLPQFTNVSSDADVKDLYDMSCVLVRQTSEVTDQSYANTANAKILKSGPIVLRAVSEILFVRDLNDRLRYNECLKCFITQFVTILEDKLPDEVKYVENFVLLALQNFLPESMLTVHFYLRHLSNMGVAERVKHFQNDDNRANLYWLIGVATRLKNEDQDGDCAELLTLANETLDKLAEQEEDAH